MFKVTVIIPVFNASKFLRTAIHSASIQQEVGEILIIEDGSSDDSYFLCQKLKREYSKVKLFTHQNHVNKGASESRNLGISLASHDLIAFLDADDYYLPGRFKKDIEVFSKKFDVNLVYSISKIEAEDNFWSFGFTADINQVSGSKELFENYRYIIINRINLVDTNSITIRKNAFQNIKLFDSRLKLHQDTELWIRLIRSNKISAGNINSFVSVARRHSNNRIIKKNIFSEFKSDFVLVDNIGFTKLYDFEKDYLAERGARILTNSISNNYLRRTLFFILKTKFVRLKNLYVKTLYWIGRKIFFNSRGI